jgi:hypothetical protein
LCVCVCVCVFVYVVTVTSPGSSPEADQAAKSQGARAPIFVRTRAEGSWHTRLMARWLLRSPV